MKNLFFNTELVKIIISEMKQMRKGALMIILFACIICACFDFVLIKAEIVQSWISQIYLIIGFIAFNLFCVKVYDEICEKQIFLKVIKNLTKDEIKVLKKFTDKNISTIHPNLEELAIINDINSKYEFIRVAGNVNHIIAIIFPEFWDALKKYFKKHKK
jgi:hypothetical protein|nr:MAG TPA: Super-infection exclusion protein B [Caudoviricetes sp.]